MLRLNIELVALAQAAASGRLEASRAQFRVEFPGCEGARLDFSPNPPDPPDTAGITRDTLQAQVDLLPKQLEAEQQYRPGFNQLNLDSLRTMLRGTTGKDATPGLLALYEQDIVPSANRMQRAATSDQRTADIEDVERLSGRYREAFRTANPEQAALRDEIYKRGKEDLTKGLSAFETERFRQNYRAANQGRLGDTGASGAGAEAFYLADREREREMQNRDYAGKLIALDQALYGDPMQAAVGRSSGISPLSMGMFQSGAGVSSMQGPTLTDPMNPLPWQTANNWMGLKTQANIAGAQNDADIYGGMLKSGVSGLMSGMAGMI